METKIVEYDFNSTGRSVLLNNKHGQDWPVVYMIHNDKELYVGETQNIYNRFEQHLNNESRKKLKKIKVVFDDEFNKSAILDIEQSLIQLFSADNKFILQNQNGGQSEKHDYYQREMYLNKVDDIWEKLYKNGMVSSSANDLRNKDIFKYSPYNTLTIEQNEVCKSVILDIIEKIDNHEKGLSIIRGTAGTGKTIVLINMIYKLINARSFHIDLVDDSEMTENNEFYHKLREFMERHKELKIGYVVPMTSIRKTLKTVFKETKNGLKSNMVIGPFDVFEDDYDILLVDESHRLSKNKNISYRDVFKKAAHKIGKEPNDTNQLEMIIERSKYQVLVYDSNQTVKGSDITDQEFLNTIKNSNVKEYTLKTQMRCKGGQLYTDYLNEIFNCENKGRKEMVNYDLALYYDVDEMINHIKELDKQYGLCRNAAGYSWEWKSKGFKNYNDVIKNDFQDIEINGHKYIWNMTNKEFIISKNAINEIGCIHTLQGYDLNYIGLIFGREIDYNPQTNRIEVDLKLFYDINVKAATDPETVRQYIINSYKVMMTRGIKGCYVFAYNENLRKYLSNFMDCV